MAAGIDVAPRRRARPADGPTNPEVRDRDNGTSKARYY